MPGGLKAELAFVDALFAEPVDACAEVRAWRAAGWEKRPPQVARILGLRTEARRHSREWRVALTRGGEFVRRLGDVLLAIDEEEGFCG
jgi:hypothetical protein